jgi:hypothetical protein
VLLALSHKHYLYCYLINCFNIMLMLRAHGFLVAKGSWARGRSCTGIGR